MIHIEMEAPLEISAADIRQWLQEQGGVVTVHGANNKVLLRLIEVAGLRGKKDVDHLRTVLCEMAARGHIALTFSDDNIGGGHIAEIFLLDMSPREEIKILKERLDAAHRRNEALYAKLSAEAPDAQAAEALLYEADEARRRAEAELVELRAKLEGLQANIGSQVAAGIEPALKEATAELERVNKALVRTERLLGAKNTELKRALEAVAGLQARLALAREAQLQEKPPVRVTIGATIREQLKPGCGCVLERHDVEQCIFGGFAHEVFPIVVKLTTNDEKREIRARIDEALKPYRI